MTTSVLDSVAGAQLDLDNPWPGLDAYQESSHAFFSGRSSDCLLYTSPSPRDS